MLADRISRKAFHQGPAKIIAITGIGLGFINLAQTQGCQRAAASIATELELVIAPFALDFESSATMISTRQGRVLTHFDPPNSKT